MARTSKDTKTHENIIQRRLLVLERVLERSRVPYMSQEKWAEEAGESKEAVRLQLDTGALARYQKPGFRKVYVNLLEEWRKAVEAEVC